MSEVQIKPYRPKPKLSYHPALTPLGDKLRYAAILSIDPVTGEKKAERGEAIDLDAYIQASAKSTDILSIIQRYEAGDETALNAYPEGSGFFGDYASLPKNLNDLQQMEGLAVRAKESFDALPKEVQDAFGSYTGFFSAVLQNKADSILADYLKSQSQVKSEPVPETPKEGE